MTCKNKKRAPENGKPFKAKGFDWCEFKCRAKFDLNGRGKRRFYLWNKQEKEWQQEPLGETWAHITEWEYE